MIREVQSGENLIYRAVDRSNSKNTTDALTLDGNTGKVTLASMACPGTILEDGWDKEAADGAAATTTPEHTIFRASAPITVKSVLFVPDATLTASDTTFATLTVSRRNADGTNAVTVASVTTKTTGGGGSGNWSAWVAVALALTAANVSLAAGQILTISIAKASTGVVVPAGQLVINYVLA